MSAPNNLIPDNEALLEKLREILSPKRKVIKNFIQTEINFNSKNKLSPEEFQWQQVRIKTEQREKHQGVRVKIVDVIEYKNLTVISNNFLMHSDIPIDQM